LAILAVRHRLGGLPAQLTQWTLVFIRERVCTWVQENGGWAQVLRGGLDVATQLAVVGMGLAVMAACGLYILKGIRR